MLRDTDVIELTTLASCCFDRLNRFHPRVSSRRWDPLGYGCKRESEYDVGAPKDSRVFDNLGQTLHGG